MTSNKNVLIFTDDSSEIVLYDKYDSHVGPPWFYGLFVNHTQTNYHVVVKGPNKKTDMTVFFGKKINLTTYPNVIIHQCENIDGKCIYPTLDKSIEFDIIVSLTSNIDSILDFISFDKLETAIIMGNKSSSREYNQINEYCTSDSSIHPNDEGSERFHDFLLESKTPVYTSTYNDCKMQYTMLFIINIYL